MKKITITIDIPDDCEHEGSLLTSVLAGLIARNGSYVETDYRKSTDLYDRHGNTCGQWKVEGYQ